MTFILAAISDFDEDDEYELPQTAWGDKAYLWFAEKNSSLDNYVFSIAQVKSRCGDRINFFDYHPNPKGDHHDFYGKAQYIDILCNIARGNRDGFSEYDLETVAELIKKGYVLNGDGGYKTAIPVFTAEQYAKAVSLAKAFVDTELGGIIRDIDRLSAKVLSEHTPKHLQSQAAGIAGMYKFVSAACIPTEILVGRKLLNPNWNPLEMPTMHVVLNR